MRTFQNRTIQNRTNLVNDDKTKFSRERADGRTLITPLKRVKERKIASLNISKKKNFSLVFFTSNV